MINHQVEILNENSNSQIPNSPSSIYQEPPNLSVENQKVIDTLDSLLEDGKHSDFVLKIGEREFKVHKAILAARSSVFALMFDANKEGEMEISDVRVEVLEHILKYIYTGTVPELDPFGPELFIASDKVRIQ